jgi:hypothetical protein
MSTHAENPENNATFSRFNCAMTKKMITRQNIRQKPIAPAYQ